MTSEPQAATARSPIPAAIREEILRRIRAAEDEHGIRVLLAVESGSRAWGFASPDSDFDARFIYVHARDWYLSINFEDRRDVVEYPIVDEIDLNGWDLRKALRLFRKSNPTFVEWIHSPIVYLENGVFASRVRSLLSAIYSVESGLKHYRSMAKTNFREYLKGDLVRLKKYFYVLRPLLAARWLEQYKTAPPIEFESLLSMIDDRADLRSDIDCLLAQKRAAPELGLSAPIPRINEFIEGELLRLDALDLSREGRGLDVNAERELDALFNDCLNERSNTTNSHTSRP